MNTRGLGPPSNEILINSGYVPEPPRAPWLDRPVVSGNTVTLSWDPASDGTPTSYLIRAGSAPGLWNLAQADTGSSATTAVFTNVPSGRYYDRVHGVNAVGAGLASNEVIVIVR